MCPVTTDESVDPEVYTEYEGERVYFCCHRCRRSFERAPGKYLINLASFSDQQHEHGEDEADHAHDAEPTEQSHDGSAGLDSHDHDRDHGQGELPALLEWVGRFHPATVHFPIGLLMASVLAELLFVVTKRGQFDSAARFCIWVGALGAVAAAILGWLFGGIQLSDDDWILTTHRWVGTTTAVAAILALGFSERSRRGGASVTRAWARAAILAAAILASAAGFFGGSLVYGLDHYAW